MMRHQTVDQSSPRRAMISPFRLPIGALLFVGCTLESGDAPVIEVDATIKSAKLLTSEAGREVSMAFKVRNTLGRPIVLLPIGRSCTCVAITVNGRELPLNSEIRLEGSEQLEIVLKTDLPARRGRESISTTFKVSPVVAQFTLQANYTVLGDMELSSSVLTIPARPNLETNATSPVGRVKVIRRARDREIVIVPPEFSTETDFLHFVNSTLESTQLVDGIWTGCWNIVLRSEMSGRRGSRVI